MPTGLFLVVDDLVAVVVLSPRRNMLTVSPILRWPSGYRPQDRGKSEHERRLHPAASRLSAEHTVPVQDPKALAHTSTDQSAPGVQHCSARQPRTASV